MSLAILLFSLLDKYLYKFMSVRLDNLERSPIEQKSLQDGYLYKDIKFDLDFSRYVKPELYSQSGPKDLAEIQDGQAVINSVKNILTTTPGQKLLNPLLGLDFRSYLYELYQYNNIIFS